MAYATLELFRKYTGLKQKDIPDDDVDSLLDEGDKWITNQLSVRVHDESLSGTIDGSNTLFTTDNKPIADSDQDGDVDGNDVTVYLVAEDAENNPVSTATAVTSVNSRDGIITLTTAPTAVNAEVGVYADYSYWKDLNEPDWDRVAQASCYYAAYLASQRADFGIVSPDFLALARKTIQSLKVGVNFKRVDKRKEFDIRFVQD